jgi:uncharacterized cupredoxin-like copper-binding protein
MRTFFAHRVALLAVLVASACLAGVAGSTKGVPTTRTLPLAVRYAAPRARVAIGVHESEFRIRLTRSSVPAGPVVIEVINDGQDPHDLHLRRADGQGSEFSFPVGRSSSRQSATFVLTAGTWRLWCSLPGHDEMGMHATLLVTTPARRAPAGHRSARADFPSARG